MNAEFLATMQIPILLGRGLEQRDMSSPRVAVVTEQFAKKFFAGENPIGRRIGFGGSKKPADIEIIGVAKTTLYNSIKETETPPVAYVPYTQDLGGLGRVHFELRTAGDPLALVNAVRETVHRASASVPVSEISTQAARIDQTISQERTFAYLCACFAVLALVIACVGLYGTMAYAVARRTNEIGIRMALGAERRRIVWMVLREVFALGAAGLAIGLAVARATSRFVGIVPVWSQTQRSVVHGGFGARAAVCGIPGRLCSGVEGIANRPDGGPAARIVRGLTRRVAPRRGRRPRRPGRPDCSRPPVPKPRGVLIPMTARVRSAKSSSVSVKRPSRSPMRESKPAEINTRSG